MEKINEILKDVGTVAIAGHKNPDGDCAGSTLGLYNYLVEYYPQLQVDLYLENLPDSFRFLKRSDQILHTLKEDIVYDLFIALDCGDTGRLGEFYPAFESAKRTCCIDHHISNFGFSDVPHIYPQKSSTAELIYELLEPEKITKEIAECIYLGIVHDTGVFQYNSTSPKTMRIAAKLMETGIDYSKIIDETYYKKTYAQNQILGRALLESMMIYDNKCIFSVLKQSDLKFHGVEPKDLDGIVNQLRITKDVEVAMLIYEVGLQEYKVSLRSNGRINVETIASHFGGGGHVRAAGCTMTGSPHDVINNLTLQMEPQMKPLLEEESTTIMTQ